MIEVWVDPQKFLSSRKLLLARLAFRIFRNVETCNIIHLLQMANLKNLLLERRRFFTPLKEIVNPIIALNLCLLWQGESKKVCIILKHPDSLIC